MSEKGIKKELPTNTKFIESSEKIRFLIFLEDDETLDKPVHDKESGVYGDLRKVAVEVAFFDQETENKGSAGKNRGDKRKIFYKF